MEVRCYISCVRCLARNTRCTTMSHLTAAGSSMRLHAQLSQSIYTHDMYMYSYILDIYIYIYIHTISISLSLYIYIYRSKHGVWRRSLVAESKRAEPFQIVPECRFDVEVRIRNVLQALLLFKSKHTCERCSCIVGG